MDEQLSEFFKLFSNVLRLKILQILDQHEQNVSDLVTLTGYSQSNISQQLKMLKQADIISSHRHGKQIFYVLKDNHIHEIIALASNHLEEKL
ncbi:ArsR/SmtB family transcription factor [Weissella bombi]|uniref:Regulatory protein, arsR family n=1 Tax=Weissella bombi TaxID=1505725 RepID=A0A1C4BFY3_9LACO|nr:metalloregulator ArsR/SmtB family transcription factor [Weissella bombi]SCC05753.1 regulatory protein, arsR family [Weissella bombi]